jgi:hypothetical protein
LLVVLGEGPLSGRPQNAVDDASTATVGEAGHRTGLVQALFQKQGHTAFALLETAHEQRYECHQSRFGRTPWHTCRKFAAGCLAAADTREPMTLIFRDESFDFRNFPDLMPQRGGIIPGQLSPTSSTHSGYHAHDLMTLVCRDQRSFVLGMARLPSLFLAVPMPHRCPLRMRVLRARRQNPDDRLRFQRLPGDHFLQINTSCDMTIMSPILRTAQRSISHPGYAGV